MRKATGSMIIQKHLFRIGYLTFFLFWICLSQSYAQKASSATKANVVQDSVEKDTENSQQAFEKLNQFVEQPVRNSADLEIDGLIVDETITKIGRDFYQIFSMQWEAPVTAKNFTILIKEKPARGNGAIITVSLNDTDLFEQNLQPRYDIIEELAIYATGVIYEALVNDQISRQLEAEGKNAREVF